MLGEPLIDGCKLIDRKGQEHADLFRALALAGLTPASVYHSQQRKRKHNNSLPYWWINFKSQIRSRSKFPAKKLVAVATLSAELDRREISAAVGREIQRHRRGGGRRSDPEPRRRLVQRGVYHPVLHHVPELRRAHLARVVSHVPHRLRVPDLHRAKGARATRRPRQFGTRHAAGTPLARSRLRYIRFRT